MNEQMNAFVNNQVISQSLFLSLFLPFIQFGIPSMQGQGKKNPNQLRTSQSSLALFLSAG